jgi:hypothetical protein
MAELANWDGNEVMRQWSKVCSGVAVGAQTRGEGGGNECGSRRRWMGRPFSRAERQ